MEKTLTNIKIILFFAYMLLFQSVTIGQNEMNQQDYLRQLLKVLSPTNPNLPKDRYISPVYLTWQDWLKRTGELPPDFDEIPNFPFLPDPLIIDQGGENIPVKSIAQWNQKREEIKNLAQHWITGTLPPPPGNLKVELLEEKMEGQLIERTVLLRFGPEHKAQLHVNLLIPQGDGPFPVYIHPWKKDRNDWVQAAVRRGYISCRYSATDPKYGYADDSEEYLKIWWPDYDFTTIARWGWAVSRAIDYLYTLNNINKNQIGLIGLSRNGKMALWAAAYDERINAVIPVSGGTGGEIPFRYTTSKYHVETSEMMNAYCPHWLHPRLQFFVGRENKLPVDYNSLMALIAPRGLMLTSSITEWGGNPWGIEQAFTSAKKVYDFLGAEDNIAIDLRTGFHSPSERDMERYLDFFDFVFGRGTIKPDNKLFYDYSFSKWLGLSNELIYPTTFPQKNIHDLLIDKKGRKIDNIISWNEKVLNIQENIKWALGDEPQSIDPGQQTDYMRDVIGSPVSNENIPSIPLLFGQLFYPSDTVMKKNNSKIPVVIYLHEYAYSWGFAKSGDRSWGVKKGNDIINRITSEGYAVYVFDQIGFGARIEEGKLFYERFPHWSKLGRMIADVRWAVDALGEIDFIDTNKIYTLGYTLGGMVGLYHAAFDKRIAGVIAISGFSPMRTNSDNKTAEGIYEYSHLHGLIPRLGFFIDNESRLPYDFEEILACIAPRKLFIISPTWDQYANIFDVKQCVDEAKNVYNLYGHGSNLQIFTPEDYNRFSDEIKDNIILWLEKNL